MPYQLNVLIEKRVILQTISGRYTIEEGINAILAVKAFFDTCSANSGIYIVDMSKMKTVEINLPKIRNGITPLLKHPNLSLFATYGEGDKIVANFITNFAAGIFKLPAKASPTEDEALKFIISKHPDLAESLPRALREYRLSEAN